jgi:hypothetical protein
MPDHVNGAQNSADENNRRAKVENQKYDRSAYEIFRKCLFKSFSSPFTLNTKHK